MPVMEESPIFVVRDIEKRFRNGYGLKFSGLSIRRRTLTLLVGESGVGKSTLLNLLGTLYRARAGSGNSKLVYRRADSAGQEVDYFKLYERNTRGFLGLSACAKLRREEFGFLPQRAHLLDTLSIKENLLTSLTLRSASKGLGSEHAEEYLATMLERVGLPMSEYSHRIRSSPASLSGGELQRLALARAILGSANVLFVDEPTTYMSDSLIDRCMGIVSEEIESRGSTAVVVTHEHDRLIRYVRRSYPNVEIDIFRLSASARVYCDGGDSSLQCVGVDPT